MLKTAAWKKCDTAAFRTCIAEIADKFSSWHNEIISIDAPPSDALDFCRLMDDALEAAIQKHNPTNAEISAWAKSELARLKPSDDLDLGHSSDYAPGDLFSAMDADAQDCCDSDETHSQPLQAAWARQAENQEVSA
jgi:hypothetical protein